MMRQLFKPFQWIYCVYAMLLFLVLMIPVFLWSLIVIWFGRIKGGDLIYKACIVWADVWLFLVGIRHKNIFLEPLQQNQSYIFVANHISYLDSAVIPKIFCMSIRPLGKVEMSKIPVFGFIYKYVIVSVDRSSAANRATSVLLLKSLLRKGISVLVFPEGTFNITNKPLKEFYDGAFRIALETGTPIKPVLLLDTYDRLHYSSIFSLNPGRSRAVFLPQVNVDGLNLKDLPVLKEKVYKMMEEELIKFGAAWVSHKSGT